MSKNQVNKIISPIICVALFALTFLLIKHISFLKEASLEIISESIPQYFSMLYLIATFLALLFSYSPQPALSVIACFFVF